MGSERGLSTKDKLLCCVDEIEIIVKELLETTIAPKNEKLSHSDQSNLISLLMSKNDEFKSTLALATEQQDIDQKMIELGAEVARQDNDIQTLQKNLKETENVLSSALFQAKQKLKQIEKAQDHQVGSEDLIRFAHRISSTNAVAAPVTWQPGDPRRPYPTDIEMRMGLLAKINDTPMSQVLDSLHPPTSNLGSSRDGYNLPWYSTTSEIPPSLPSSFMPVRNDDVEVMSTDSSSSSSSDSQ